MSWFSDIIEGFVNFFSPSDEGEKEVSFDFDEVGEAADEVVFALEAGDTTTAEDAVGNLEAIADALGVDIGTATSDDLDVLRELAWEEKEAEAPAPLEAFAAEMGIDLETATAEDVEALHSLWVETSPFGEFVEMEDDGGTGTAFGEWLRENFPDIDPVDVEDALDLFGGDNGIEIAAAFATLEEAMAYTEGVSPSILHVELVGDFWLVTRIYTGEE